MIKTCFKRISYAYLLLTLLALSGLGLFLSGRRVKNEIKYDVLPNNDPVFHVDFDGLWVLSFEEAQDLALYFDKLYDQMGESPYPEPTAYRLNELALEVLPFFEYEGIPVLATYPDMLELYPFQEAREHSHTAGRSDCQGFILNYRYANPFSDWYNEGSWVATAIHEMVHVQQGALCALVDNYYVEMTAEIVSLEVMAAVANYGNRGMTYALVRKLRGMAASAAYGLALEAGEIEKYDRLHGWLMLDRANRHRDVYRRGRFEKSRRFWETNPERLTFILKAYSIDPLERIVQAILYKDKAVEGLIMPPGQIFVHAEYADSFVPGPPFVLDDLAYFLEHSEELVTQYVRERDSDD